MKLKKGFTLVELLAVIAILALLVIISMPKILDLFNDAKENMFVTEAKEIYNKVSVVQIKEATNGNSIAEISNDTNALDLDDNIIYDIKLNSNGKIDSFYLTNGNYTICGNKSNGEDGFNVKNITTSNIREGQVEKYDNCIIGNTVTDMDKPISDDDSTTGNNPTDNIIAEDPSIYYDISASEDTNVLAPENCYTVLNNTIVDYSNDASCPKNIRIPSIIDGTKITKIGDHAFYLNKITSITLPNIITDIGNYAFYYDKLSNVTIPNSVINIGDYAFSVNGLINVTLSNNVENIGNNAFYYNDISSIIIPSSVKTIGEYAFSVNQLSDVVIPNGLTVISNNVFYHNKLTSVTIPNGVTTIGNYAFYYNSLSSVVVPNSVTSIGDYAFYGNKLTNILIQGKNSSSEFLSYGKNLWGINSSYNCIKDNISNVSNGCITWGQ